MAHSNEAMQENEDMGIKTMKWTRKLDRNQP